MYTRIVCHNTLHISRASLERRVDDLVRDLRNARRYGVDPYNSAVKLTRTREVRAARHEGEANRLLAGVRS